MPAGATQSSDGLHAACVLLLHLRPTFSPTSLALGPFAVSAFSFPTPSTMTFASPPGLGGSLSLRLCIKSLRLDKLMVLRECCRPAHSQTYDRLFPTHYLPPAPSRTAAGRGQRVPSQYQWKRSLTSKGPLRRSEVGLASASDGRPRIVCRRGTGRARAARAGAGAGAGAAKGAQVIWISTKWNEYFANEPGWRSVSRLSGR
jgi:hypothetical protein